MKNTLWEEVHILSESYPKLFDDSELNSFYEVSP